MPRSGERVDGDAATGGRDRDRRPDRDQRNVVSRPAGRRPRLGARRDVPGVRRGRPPRPRPSARRAAWATRSSAAAASGAVNSQLALAQHLGVDRTVMTYLLDDLEAAGLIERQADPADRRARRVVATEAGQQRLDELDQRLRDVESDLLAPLDPAAQASFRAQLRLLATDAGRTGTDRRPPTGRSVPSATHVGPTTRARRATCAGLPTKFPVKPPSPCKTCSLYWWQRGAPLPGHGPDGSVRRVAPWPGGGDRTSYNPTCG